MVFFFNDTATTEIYTLSLHDALPIFARGPNVQDLIALTTVAEHRDTQAPRFVGQEVDRKSTRLNSSHANISYAVFCLKKKNNHPHLLTDPPQCDQHLLRLMLRPSHDQ